MSSTSEILNQLNKFGMEFDSELSSFSKKQFVFWFSFDGNSMDKITFSSFNEALRFAKREVTEL